MSNNANIKMKTVTQYTNDINSSLSNFLKSTNGKARLHFFNMTAETVKKQKQNES